MTARLCHASSAQQLWRGRGRAVAERETNEEENCMTDYDPRTDTGIPTEPVGFASAAGEAAGGLRGVRRGQDLQGGSREAAGRGRKDSIERGEATGVADHLRRRAALVVVCDLPDRRHAGRHRPGGRPRPGRPVLRDLRRRPWPSAAQARERPAEVQLLRGRHAEEVASVRDEADEAGRHRAVDARAAVPAEGPGRRLHARGVRGGHRPGVRDRHPQGLRGRRGARLDRLHGGPPGHA